MEEPEFRFPLTDYDFNSGVETINNKMVEEEPMIM